MAEKAHSSISIPNKGRNRERNPKMIAGSDLLCTTESGVPITQLYVRNLPYRPNRKDISAIFGAFGQVKSTVLIKNFSHTYAFVGYYNTQDALKARMAEVKYKNKVLEVWPAKDQQSKKKKAAIKKKERAVMKKKEKDENDGKPNYIDMLDDDCLHKIFLELSIKDRTCIQRVCRRWNQVSQQAWTDIHVLDIKYNFVWTIIAEKGANREVLHAPNVEAVEKLLKCCGRFLKSLSVGTHKSTTQLPNLITNHCYNITKLRFELCTYPRAVMAKMFHTCQKLTSLFMTSSEPRFINNCIVDAEKCPLTELHLDGASVLDKFKKLSPMAIITLSNFSSLHTLSLRCIDLKLVDFKAISKISSLTNFSLSHCECFNGTLNFLKNMPQLQRLNLEGAPQVTDKLLQLLAESCRHLRYLNIGQCDVTNAGLRHLARLGHLETLVITDTEVTGDTLWQISSLKTVECQNSEVDDSSMIKLIETVPGLKLLDLRNTSITDETIEEAKRIIANRKNGVVLKIIIDDNGDIEYDAHPVPLLVIEMHINESDESIDHYDSDSDEDEDDEYDYPSDELDLDYLDYDIGMFGGGFKMFGGAHFFHY